MMLGSKTSRNMVALLAISAGACCVLSALANNPYAGIVDRNVFSLKPPAPTVAPPPPEAPPSKLTLNGITTIIGHQKRALLSAQVPATGQQPAHQETYMLAEGEKDGDIQVISIDDKAGSVKLSNKGAVETVDFVNNGAKLTAPPPPVPGQPPGTPGFTPAALRGLSGGPGQRSIPTRQLRNSQVAGSQPEYSPGGPMANNFNPSAPSPQYQSTMEPDQQVLMIEAQRAKMLQEGDPTAKILPPTELTPAVTGEGNGNSAPSPF